MAADASGTLENLPFEGGRLSRLAYLAFIIGTFVAAILFVMYWESYRFKDNRLTIFGIAPLVALPMKYLAVNARLRDARLSRIMSTPAILLLAVHIFTSYYIPNFGAPSYLWPWNPIGIAGLEITRTAFFGLIFGTMILFVDCLLLATPSKIAVPADHF